MAGDDQAVDNAGMSPRPLPQGFRGPDRIHLYGAGAEELLKPAQCHRLRNLIVVPEGMERLGNNEIGHEHVLTADQRALDPATGNSTSACARGSPISRRSTTEVSSLMATRPSVGNASTDVAQPMRLSLGVPAKRTHPGPVGPRTLQDPHGLLPDEPALHRDLLPGSEAELLAQGCREGGLALGGDGDDVHAPERIADRLTRQCIR